MTDCDCTISGERTEHCPVRGCHQSFSGPSAGDMHRTGKHHLSTGPDRRRCLTVDEMLAKGMARNARGVWLTPSAEVREAQKAARATAVEG